MAGGWRFPGWQTLLRRWAAVLAATVLVGGLTPPGRAQTSDPLLVAQTFRAAIAAQDPEAVLALWDDDGVYLFLDHAGAYPLGLAALRQRLPEVFAADRRITVSAFRVADDRVTYAWQTTLDPAVGRDLPTLEGTDELVIRDGKIHRWTRRPDPEAADRQRRAVDAVLAARAAQREQAAAATAVAASGVLGRTPDTQGRRTPSPALWGIGAVAILLMAGLAAFARLRTTP